MIKILAIDDQPLVILPIQKRLTALGYSVLVETNALKVMSLVDSFHPDLVVLDINMPELSGLELISEIQRKSNHSIPIVVLSGNIDDDMIVKCFDLGVKDYMKKPLSLNEICARIKMLVGVPDALIVEPSKSEIQIQQRCVGVVVPCYNEEERLLKDEFLNFVDKNSGYHLCFVNDGSTDGTHEKLLELQKDRETKISVLHLEKNQGKAEAVRNGMLHLSKMKHLDYVGYLDADLSTDLHDYDELVSSLENSNYKIVCGSRIQRMGAVISKGCRRKIVSCLINLIIVKILRMNISDTQCGAKIFKRTIVRSIFQYQFKTDWLFDVEIFIRIKRIFKTHKNEEIIYEKPLKRWIHKDGSKLSFKDSLSIIGQLIKIAWFYRKSNTNSQVLKGASEKLLFKQGVHSPYESVH